MKRRFIAGAVCPQCQVLDRLVVEDDGLTTLRKCVACGFSDDLVNTSTSGVPRGKPERPRSADNTESQAVRIFDGKPDRKT